MQDLHTGEDERRAVGIASAGALAVVPADRTRVAEGSTLDLIPLWS